MEMESTNSPLQAAADAVPEAEGVAVAEVAVSHTEAPADALPATPKKVKKQYPALDLMKFMGILIVVWYHCRLIIVPNIRTDNSLDQYFFYLITTLVGPCVPFFFIVNGFLQFDKPLNLKKHLKTTWHFVWITLIWSAITLFATLLARGYAFNFSIFGHHLFTLNPDGYPVSLKYFLKNTVLIKNLITDGQTAWYYHLWFMGAMVILYLFFPLLKLAWDHDRKIYYFFLGAVFVIVFGNKALNMCLNVFSWLLTGRNPARDFEGNMMYTGYNFLSIFNPFQGIDGYIFVYFMLGAILKEKMDRFLEIFTVRRCIIGIILTTACLYLYGYFMTKSTNVLWNSGDQYGNDIVFSLVRVLCIFGLACRYKGTGFGSRFIKYIARNTLGIYFIHYVIRNLTYLKLQDLPIPGYFTKTTLYFIVVFAISWGIMEIMKRVPGLRRII